MSWKKTALKIGLVALEAGLKEHNKRSSTGSKKRKKRKPTAKRKKR